MQPPYVKEVAHSQMASVFLFIQCTRVCVQMLMGPNTHFIKTSLVCFHPNFFFSTFLSCVLVVTHCRAGELWKTPDWSAKKTTSMSASCACVLSWTTRSVLCSPRRTSIQTACPSGLKHTYLTEAKFNFFHCVFSVFNLSCRGMHLLFILWLLSSVNELICLCLTPSCCYFFFSLQYGFNMVMSHPHAVNEIALSLNNKNPR